MRRRLAALVLGTIAVAAAAPASAGDDMFDGAWHFSVAPYLWLPVVHGTVTYPPPLPGSGSISAQVDPGQYLESLDFAGMVIGEARKGEWSAFTDYIFLHLNSHKSAIRSVTDPTGEVEFPVPIGRSGSASLVSNVWTLAGSYTVWRGETAFVDVFAGTRLLNFNSTIGWNLATPFRTLPPGGSRSVTLNEWSAIAGFKGQLRLGESNWFMPYYADIGTGSNAWTWQAILGVGYRYKWGDVSLVVRSLSYYFDNDKLDLRMTGPALGATFAF